MASIRKRGNSYQITVSKGYDIVGKKLLETTTFTPDPSWGKRQAERELRLFADEFERDMLASQDLRGRKMTLEELADLFLEDNKPGNPPSADDPLSITTWSEYRRSLKTRILPILGHIRISEIIPKTLKDFSKELREDGSRQDGKAGGLSESSIGKFNAIVSTLLSYAVGEGLIQINPLIYAGRQAKGRRTKREYKVKTLEIPQVQALLWAFDNPISIGYGERKRKDSSGKVYSIQKYRQTWQLSLKWRAYFYLSLFAGDRRGENISLTWNSVDFSAKSVRIEASTAYVDGKVYQKDTKTHQSRVVIVPQAVIDVLSAWKKEQQRACIELGTYWQGFRGTEYDKNYIFTQENGLQMHPDSPYRQFKRVIRLYNDNIAANDENAVRIPDNITPHDLRHTAASILIKNNLDPRTVSGVLGHADPSTTLNIYSYFFHQKSQEAADIMQKELFKKRSV